MNQCTILGWCSEVAQGPGRHFIYLFPSHFPLAGVWFRFRAFLRDDAIPSRRLLNQPPSTDISISASCHSAWWRGFFATIPEQVSQFRRPAIPHEDARSRYGQAPVTSCFQGLRTLRIRGGELQTRRRGKVTKKRTVESIKREMATNWRIPVNAIGRTDEYQWRLAKKCERAWSSSLCVLILSFSDQNALLKLCPFLSLFVLDHVFTFLHCLSVRSRFEAELQWFSCFDHFSS